MKIEPILLPALVETLNKETGLQTNGTIIYEQFYMLLVQHIAYLIGNHFEQLIFLLYRIDVKEDDIKQLLQLHAINEAPSLIANAIIKRQYEKLCNKKAATNFNGISKEEKW